MSTPNDKKVFIGLAEGTGSGKTTVSAAVRRAAGGQVIILTQDAIYRAQSDLPPAAAF